jgi:hypothetical protein
MRRGVAQMMVRAEHDASAPAGVDDCVRVVERHRERLLAEHVLARVGRRDCLRRMKLVGRADIHGVDAGIGEQRVERRATLRDPVLRRIGFAACAIAAQHRRHRVTRLRADRVDHPFVRDRARADQSPPQFVSHRDSRSVRPTVGPHRMLDRD